MVAPLWEGRGKFPNGGWQPSICLSQAPGHRSQQCWGAPPPAPAAWWHPAASPTGTLRMLLAQPPVDLPSTQQSYGVCCYPTSHQATGSPVPTRKGNKYPHGKKHVQGHVQVCRPHQKSFWTCGCLNTSMCPQGVSLPSSTEALQGTSVKVVLFFFVFF